MEQCSSEPTALYKAAITKGGRLADLTGGFGIDCSYMSRGFREATDIYRNSILCNIAKENFTLLGLGNINIINGNSEDILPTLPKQDWIFIDPARRDKAGNKVVSLKDCTPDVCRLKPLLMQKATRMMIKCSPMLDISQAVRELQSVSEVHVVSVNNECKELLLILGGAAVEGSIHTINYHGGEVQKFVYAASEEVAALCPYATSVARYLYEPNSSLMKAGCYRLPAQRYGLSKLHPNTHLYTSDTLVSDFPGRVFRVERVCGFGKKELKTLGCKQANLAVRNFPERVDALQKRLKIQDGGSTYLFATTLQDESKALIVCTKAESR
jgi:16S rRNA G966 N2-methylase RsmD